jgi:hypothetical protein
MVRLAEYGAERPLHPPLREDLQLGLPVSDSAPPRRQPRGELIDVIPQRDLECASQRS